MTCDAMLTSRILQERALAVDPLHQADGVLCGEMEAVSLSG